MELKMDENNWFGKEVIITGPVKCNEDDEDLKLYAECCKKVCEMYVEIQNEQHKSQSNV